MSKVLEQLKERLQLIWSQFLESSAYNSFREKFDALSSRAQKLIIAGVSALIVLILLMIPYSYWSSSWDHMTSFETNRGLIREFLKAVRMKQENPAFPPSMPSQVLQGRVDEALKDMSLNSEQIGAISPLENKGNALVPPGVRAEGLDIELKKLNVLQIIDIGHRLQTLDPSLRMIGMSVQRSNNESHYYDVTFKIISLGVGS